MIGAFKNAEECKNSLRKEGYKFSHMFDGRMVFTVETAQKIKFAEISVYPDDSCSALIGESNKK
jgi:hypothetical protein